MAGGLRALLDSRGEPVADTTVRVYVPVWLRLREPDPPGDHPGAQEGNRIAQMAIPLALGEPDPGRRLRRIAAETSRRKAKACTSLGTLFGGRVARRLLLAAIGVVADRDAYPDLEVFTAAVRGQLRALLVTAPIAEGARA